VPSVRDGTRFHESRRLSRTWVAVLAVLSLPGVVVGAGVILSTGPLDGTAAVLLALVVGPAVLLTVGPAAMRLTVAVDDEGLWLRLWPLHRSSRHVAPAEITAVSVTDGRPSSQFGGVGIRFGGGEDGWFSGPVAYLVGGEESGVRVERADGRTVVVGTERPTELRTALDRVRGR
jgi:hypothetical protein